MTKAKVDVKYECENCKKPHSYNFIIESSGSKRGFSLFQKVKIDEQDPEEIIESEINSMQDGNKLPLKECPRCGYLMLFNRKPKQ